MKIYLQNQVSITSIVEIKRQQTIQDLPEKTHDPGGKVIITSSRKCGAGSIILLLEGISINKEMQEKPGSFLEDSFSDINVLHDEIHYKNLREKNEDPTEICSLLEQNTVEHSL